MSSHNDPKTFLDGLGFSPEPTTGKMTEEKELYPIWNDVPVMYQDCTTLEQKIKHRLRRAAEKSDDYQLDKWEQAKLSWEKLLAVEEIFEDK